MIDHVIKVAFVVEDVEKAVEFYTKICDLEVMERFPSDTDEDFVFLESKSIIIELLPKNAMGDIPLGFHHLAFNVESVDQALKELRNKGARILAEPFNAGVGGIRP